MKYAIPLSLVLSVILSGCSGRFYADAGMGYISEVTVHQELTVNGVTVENEFNLPIDSGFMLFRGGYRVERWHLEYEQITNAERHFDTVRIYRRFEF